jgi:hypothetical protein
VVLSLLRRGAKRRVNSEEVANELLGTVGHWGPNVLGCKNHDALEDIIANFLEAFPAATSERRISGQKEVCDNPDSPDVARRRVGATNNFRGDRIRSADRFVLDVAVFKMLGKTKVNELEFAPHVSVLKEEVFQLEITVNDSPLVTIADGAQHLLHEADAKLFRVVVIRLLIKAVE